MKITIGHRAPNATSYRAARVKSLFNATDDQATRFDLSVDLPIDDGDWAVGVVAGPSGSGKSSIGRALWDGTAFYDPHDWPADAPIVDAIAPDGGFEDVTGALAPPQAWATCRHGCGPTGCCPPASSSGPTSPEARACRMVVMPEWQGAPIHRPELLELGAGPGRVVFDAEPARLRG